MEAAIQLSLSDTLVVDGDVHVHETPRALAPHCEMPWRRALEAIQDVPERYLDLPGFSPGESAGGYQAQFPTSSGSPPRVVATRDQMREELSALAIDIGVLFPDHLLKLPVLTQTDYAAALARAYNRWLVAEWVDEDVGLLGAIVACPQAPDTTVLEINTYAGLAGVVGVYLPCAGIDPLWGHRRYDAIYDAAESAGLPVLLHSATVTHPVFPFNNHGFDTELARHALSHPFSIMANLTSMVTTGVPVRFPGLRVGVFEAGISWVPFLMNRLDKEYIVGQRREVPFLVELPSHYLRTFHYATQPIEEPRRPGDFAALVELYDGEDTTMFASDWPHSDFDSPTKLAQMPMSSALRANILGANAMRFFDIRSLPGALGESDRGQN